LANLQAALPSQYLYKDTTAWMMHPTTIGALRKLKASTTANNFIEVGDDDGGAVLYIFGHRVIPNPYMDVAGEGKFPVYLAEWSRFFTIADNEMMSIKRFDQTAPGFIFDGFPRTVAQAEALDALLAKHETSIACMIMLNVPEEELKKRLLERGKTSGRADDQNEEKINVRIQEYLNKTVPVAEFYTHQNKICKVNGVGSIEGIFDQISLAIDGHYA
jgi:hypothetical protein